MLHLVYSLLGREKLGHFHILLITNNTALNICVQVFMWTYVFSPLRSRSGIVISVYEEMPHMIVPFSIPTNSVSKFQFFHILASAC